MDPLGPFDLTEVCLRQPFYSLALDLVEWFTSPHHTLAQNELLESSSPEGWHKLLALTSLCRNVSLMCRVALEASQLTSHTRDKKKWIRQATGLKPKATPCSDVLNFFTKGAYLPWHYLGSINLRPPISHHRHLGLDGQGFGMWALLIASKTQPIKEAA
jgi:hypothetical protein